MQCKICLSNEGRGKNNLCRKCWRKEYDKRNKKKIREQHTINYFENREQRLNLINKWQNRNKPEIANQKREYYKENKDEFIERQKTRHYFKHLKETSKCGKCGSTIKLEFHHKKPYKYNVFQILCFKCHRELHGQLFTKKQKHKLSKKVKTPL